MQIGKLRSEQLEDMIFQKLKNKREEVLVRPGIGRDCAVVDYGEQLCVLSTDPITGTATNIGKLVVHITCNDIAADGVAPLGIMLTIMLPPGTTEADVENIMNDIICEADKINVDILGGHTEVTDAVNRVVISATGIGKKLKSKLENAKKPAPGDFLILTKGSGIEGTGIICYDKEDELKQALGSDIVEQGKLFLEKLSVVREGVIGGENGAKLMHDVTEGGVLGGVWEISVLSKLGVRLLKDKVPVSPVTDLVCSHFGIDPLKLMSSGSMLILADEEDSEKICGELTNAGIESCIIGWLEEGDRRVIVEGGMELEIESPESDELYKVLK
ncbi:putative hydrogenase expression/formation protein [Peptoclostridium acidaminophilum DSM 3953]|uniref:Putative hydrogenase expression/formation protein n=1 Tax=Peptoclostridium acidaminophilum DSM 3953 TaxID=1286171 RepID=W8T2P7_PEPAC|nr:AIR synthase family protein [Peptoclostridium acidaminophilum]AHM56019.1 putative hydrogenase expression/formation protein [Peptoclostridium acidaminophilum DSM 3953]